MTAFEFDYLGPYHVERLIGRGGMGSVYKALHAKTGQPVAIKVIATGIANQPRFRRRFAAEIEALKRLRHPNIVSLIGYGEEKGILFYSMEYVAGQSIHELLRSEKQLQWQQAVQIGVETTAALKHAHNIGIIHRDLKPANLMLDNAGTVKLTDFGIAKLFGSTDETALGAVVGTADYMPPEQAEGKPVTIRSDLYSLGCVLYAMLSGRPPFTGKSVPEVLYSVRYSPVPDLRELAGQAPEELVELVLQLLEKDPQKRPPTALVVGNRLKAIQQAMKGKNPLAGQSSSSHTAAPPTQVTKVGNKLTSLDMDDDEIQLTGKEISELPMQDTQNERPLGTHEKQTVLASSSFHQSKGSSHADDPKESELSSEHLSEHSETSRQLSGATHSSSISSGGASHYTPVSDSESTHYRPAYSRQPAESHRWDWLQMLSIIGIVGLLLASIAFIWWKLQPETAEQLYASIIAAAESGDDTQLMAVSGQINEFLHRFPDDERAIDVQAMSDEAELVRRVRMLQRKAAREGGINELSVVEQAFLDSLQTRSQDYETGQGKLEALISVFSGASLDPKDQRLVELAAFAKNAALKLSLDQSNKARVQLEETIQSAEKNLTEEKLRQFYSHILTLYDKKPWAQEQIERIQRLLDKEESL
jgi:serine/threonine protein kinase